MPKALISIFGTRASLGGEMSLHAYNYFFLTKSCLFKIYFYFENELFILVSKNHMLIKMISEMMRGCKTPHTSQNSKLRKQHQAHSTFQASTVMKEAHNLKCY